MAVVPRTASLPCSCTPPPATLSLPCSLPYPPPSLRAHTPAGNDDDTTWAPPNRTLYHGAGNGWCRSDLDSGIGDYETPDQCWEACVESYGDEVQAIVSLGRGRHQWPQLIAPSQLTGAEWVRRLVLLPKLV